MDDRTMGQATMTRTDGSVGIPAAAHQHQAADLWRRWVVANVAGEVIGFGLAAVAGTLVAAVVATAHGPFLWLLVVAGIVVVGGIEGTAVGLAQWLALRTALPAISRGTWLGATVIGAVAAWGVGMAIGTSVGDRLALPSSPFVMLAVAAIIGAVAGALLSAAQWLVLRRATPGAAQWVPAHAGAWAIGMVIAFAGTGAIDEGTPISMVALIGAGTGLAMGGGVAALTGLALVRIVRPRQQRVNA